MTAAATKPRAPAHRAQKETPAAAAARITASVIEKLAKLDNLAEAGITAGGEAGDLGGRLFWLATNAVMPKVRSALGGGPFTSEAVTTAANELYDLQALAAGAEALHGEDGRGAIASSAVQLIDSITDELDQPLIWPDAVTDGRSDFERGRDLAIAMLEKGREIEGTDEAESLRWYRDGRAQNRFALDYLHELFEQPELIDGFAAVLSAMLSSSDATDIACLAVARAEYEAGVAGEDGTLAGEIDDAAITATSITKAAPQEPVAEADSDAVRTAILDALAEGTNAVSVLRAAAHDATDAHFGVLALARLALDGIKAVELESSTEGMDQALSDASCLYAQVIAVCSAVNTDSLDDELMHAGESLLILAKYYVDAAIDALQ